MGLLVAGTVLLVAVGLRAAERSTLYGVPPRYPLIMLSVSVSVSVSSPLAGLAMALRAEQRARQATEAERDRIRLAFRDTVKMALPNAGGTGTVDRSYLDSLVQPACHEAQVGPDVGRRLAQLSCPDPGFAALTRREREIPLPVAGGLCDREIAQQLVVCADTVRVHISNAMARRRTA